MVLYLIIIAIFAAIIIHHHILFTRIYYSSLTLNKLREIKYKAIVYLSENVKEKMPVEDAMIFRGFLAAIKFVIFSTESTKGSLINFKGVKIIYLHILLHKWKKSGFRELINENELAKEYAGEVKDAIDTAIKAIPLFYLRIVLFFIKAVIYHLLIKIGFKGLKKKLEDINAYISIYKLKKSGFEII